MASGGGWGSSFRPRVDRGGPIDSSLLREGVRSFVYSKHPYRSHWDRRGPIRSQQSRIRRCVTKGVALESDDMCKEEENAKRLRAARAGQREKVAAVWKNL